jgi:hypothetical protein
VVIGGSWSGPAHVDGSEGGAAIPKSGWGALGLAAHREGGLAAVRRRSDQRGGQQQASKLCRALMVL